jgi:molybdopterin converting factor small subunit
MAMNVYICEDDANHSAYTTESTTVGQLKNERGMGEEVTVSIDGRVVGNETALQANDAIAFVTARKTGGN